MDGLYLVDNVDPDFCPECGVGVLTLLEAVEDGYLAACTFCRKTMVLDDSLRRATSVLF